MGKAGLYSIIEMKRLDGKKFTTPGINWGHVLTIIEESPTKLLAYCPGGKQWFALGEQKYYPPFFKVFEKVGHNRLLDPIGSPEFEYRRGGRKAALAQAMEVFKS